LSDEELQLEAEKWRLAIIPIFATTGANTKILFALQHGIPIVSTVAAAAPFALGDGVGINSTRVGPVAALGSSSIDLALLASRVLGDVPLASRLGAAAKQHFAKLTQSTTPMHDVQALVSWVCCARQAPPAESFSLQPELGQGGLGIEANSVQAQPLPHSGRCGLLRPGLTIVSSCGLEQIWPGAAARIQSVWLSLCDVCAITCRMHAAASNTTADASLLIDTHCHVHPNKRLATEESRREQDAFIFYSWDPALAGLLYHSRGALLRTVAASEAVAAAVTGPCDATREQVSAPAWLGNATAVGLGWCDAPHMRGLVVRVNRLDSLVSWRASWSAAVAATLAANTSVTEALVRQVAEPRFPAFVRELRGHIARPHWA